MAAYFEAENYRVSQSEDGEGIDRLIAESAIDVVLLDINLPGKDGLQLARELSEKTDVGIILVTARNDEIDRIVGLEIGADDYVTKPFDLDELLARVRGHLRRQVWSKRDSSNGDPGEEIKVLEFGDCRVDFQTLKAITHSGEEVQLTWKEAMMMRLFSEREGEVIQRGTFLEEVWGEPGTLETRTVDNFVLRLRKYFEPVPKQPRHIISVRGVGYRFVR